MYKRTIIVFVFLILFSSGCGRISNKVKQLVSIQSENISLKSKPEDFSIRDIVTGFKGDSSIKEIKGVQIDMNMLYVEYCVYRGEKDRVLKGVERIEPQRKTDYGSDSLCKPTTMADFLKHTVPNAERNDATEFFWKLTGLKNYEVYECLKAPMHHYIIFDKNSDTVYHRMEELRD